MLAMINKSNINIHLQEFEWTCMLLFGKVIDEILSLFYGIK
jgi:hypothetical protein